MVWDSSVLVSALKKQVLVLEADLRARVDGSDLAIRQDGVYEAWRSEYDAQLKAERTGISWVEWRNDRITQAAVSWVLLTVFARYCEDNHLVTPRWISGSTDDERGHALDARTDYFRTNPEHTDRDWLTTIADHFAHYPATAGLVDPYTPMWQIAPSGDAARTLLEFWWDRDDTGQPRWSFTGVDTRFLGDVYQDLSDHAKKTYALLQTPEFVEEFILDRTLEPALADRPLDGFTMIDPTCGSGHFLLGAFHRLHTRWQHHAPALNQRELVQKALDAVHGVDINPFAVAIARFRLLIAALHAAGDTNLEQPIGYTTHLAAGDSLLWGAPQQALTNEMLTVGTPSSPTVVNTTENTDALTRILQREHDTVVGNPPYITTSDSAKNALYRQLYTTPHRQYALTIPFAELFFKLARSSASGRYASGWVGQITSNSFMKRKFGIKLIEEFFPTVDLREIIDTSGAYIPGHGTPTVILIGRNTPPQSANILGVLGKRGSVGRIEVPEESPAWLDIVSAVNVSDTEFKYVSSKNLPRQKFSEHPWSLTGGAADQVMRRVEDERRRLAGDLVDSGFAIITGEDDAYCAPNSAPIVGALQPAGGAVSYIDGLDVRDYVVTPNTSVLSPKSAQNSLLQNNDVVDHLWPMRRLLQTRRRFGVPVENIPDFDWYEFRELYPKKLIWLNAFCFAFVATHNHFCRVPDGAVSNRSAPLILLKTDLESTRVESILELLNSSTICFWMKEKSHNMGEGGGARVDAGYAARGERWRESYQFNVSILGNLPLPKHSVRAGGKSAHEIAEKSIQYLPRSAIKTQPPLPDFLNSLQSQHESILESLIAQQEEIDWWTYFAYGLTDEDLTFRGSPPSLRAGERTFEIALARQLESKVEDSTWFSHPLHLATPTTEIPTHLPADYQALLQRRLDEIATNPHIELLERPEYKRRWATEPWDKQVLAAQRTWLLDRLENRDLWFDRDGRPTPRSVAQLADLMDHDPTYREVLTAWAGNPDITTTNAMTKLLDDEHVPYLAAYRYKPAGMDKRHAWEHTWDLQRREDAGDTLDAPIPVPPKYKPTDFRQTSYWSHRGKLDVPKERFISYPNAGRDTDHTLLLGWAGWDHGEQALALATLTTERTDDGFTTEQLTPLIAGLHELQPWVRQWHNTIDPDYGQSLADTIDEELHTHLTTHHLTTTDLLAWQPTQTTRGRRTKKATT
ncbi:hypothetical protein RhoFasSB10_04930 [Rhodococcus fascians]|uniref:BREX-2 system adenine-specific DNA-methyltransferase PglX n=1 Tax=Rhodococcoides fascians TaxID=1828 RepID=UPI001427A37F|nr:hypothetical protein [Rhodococcus fascians]